jgi:hypothetical protein
MSISWFSSDFQTSSWLPETDAIILKIFSRKESAKKLAFMTHNEAKLFKNLIITLFFEKNANFFAENRKKTVIITSTPGAKYLNNQIKAFVFSFIRRQPGTRGPLLQPSERVVRLRPAQDGRQNLVRTNQGDQGINVMNTIFSDFPPKFGENVAFFFLFLKKGCPVWGANPGSYDFVYVLIPSLFCS